MSASTTSPADPPSVKHVLLYGNDHSPWVQAVLLGLREKGIEHTNVMLPPAPLFAESGVLMPAARIDDGPWRHDSERILVALGYSPVKPEDRATLLASFGMTALRRADSAWGFWHRFSLVRDGDPAFAHRLWHQLWRPFSMLYFFTLIRFARRRFAPATREQLIAILSRWQERLGAESPFLGGAAPDTTDFQLFGLVQMCASIPGLAFDVVRHEPELEGLRGWIGAMHARFDGYPHLYTGPSFAPEQPPVAPAPLSERVAYWCGSALMWLGLPVTLPLVLYFVRRVRAKGLVSE